MKVCVKYFNLLYRCKKIWKVPSDLQFVETRHRYTTILYFMITALYNCKSNRNCVVLELVKTTDLFNNVVGDRNKENPDMIVVSENTIGVLTA